MKPCIEMQEVELEQMIAESIGIVNEGAKSTDGYYDDSRLDIFEDEE